MMIILSCLVFLYSKSLSIYDYLYANYYYYEISPMFIHKLGDTPYPIMLFLAPQIDIELTSLDPERRARVLQLLRSSYKNTDDARLLHWALLGYQLDLKYGFNRTLRLELICNDFIPIKKFITPCSERFCDDIFNHEISDFQCHGDMFSFYAICFIYRENKDKLLPYFEAVDKISKSDYHRLSMYVAICTADVPGWRELFRERQKTELGKRTQLFIKRALSDAEMLKRFAGYRKEAGYGDYISPEDAPWDDQVTPSGQSK